MKRTYLTFLSLVRLGSFLLLLASVTLIALGQFLWGVAALAVALALSMGLYRCPDCRRPLDERLRLRHLSVCPYCGCNLKNRKFPFVQTRRCGH